MNKGEIIFGFLLPTNQEARRSETLSWCGYWEFAHVRAFEFPAFSSSFWEQSRREQFTGRIERGPLCSHLAMHCVIGANMVCCFRLMERSRCALYLDKRREFDIPSPCRLLPL